MLALPELQVKSWLTCRSSPSASVAVARSVRSLEPTLTSARSASTGSMVILPAGMVTETMQISVRPLWEVAVTVVAPMPVAVNLP